LLAGTVSHEMMTPLNSILNLSKLILDRTLQEERGVNKADMLPDIEISKYISIIYKSSNLLYYLIKDLLDLLKI
jgi:signal transduction histidine kinase